MIGGGLWSKGSFGVAAILICIVTAQGTAAGQDATSAKEALIRPEAKAAALHTTAAAVFGNPANLLFPLDGTYALVDFFGDGPSGNGPATGPDQQNDDDSATVPLSFTFELYGEQYTTAYVNNNGNVSFAGYFSTFTSTGFPSIAFKMVAPFWADVDTRSGNGQVWQKLTSNTLVVTWANVGYFAVHGDKLNTFQVAISDGTNPVMGLGNNVCFSYDDMQWTTGDASDGVGGFGGTPATVGANRGNGTDFFQIGRFDHEGTDYNGPSGNPSGVSYLDGRVYCFSTKSTTSNINPIPSGFPAGDSITIDPSAGQSLATSVSFLSPEAGQTTTVVIDDVNGAVAAGLNITNTPGNTANVGLNWTPTCADSGSYALGFTASDDFSPPGVTTVTLTINVQCASVATATPSPTVSATGSPTPTETPTATVPGATATPTNTPVMPTPTATDTPVPATATATPVQQLNVQPPGPHNFGSVAIGSQKTFAFTISNSGGGTLTGTAVTACAGFSTAPPNFSLDAGQQMSIVVTFAPPSAGQFSCQLSILSNGGNAAVDVSGIGVASPAIPVIPSPMSPGGAALIALLAAGMAHILRRSVRRMRPPQS